MVLAAYFLFGAFAVCAQAALVREVHVVVLGSELSWGLVLAFWLAGTALGAFLSGRFVGRGERGWPTFVAAGTFMPVMFVAETALVRLARPFLGIGPGEYIGPGGMITLAAVATLPISFWIGVGFVAASAIVSVRPGESSEARSIGWVYAVESAGCLVGGALFSLVLVERLSSTALAFGGEAVLGGGLALAAWNRERLRWIAIFPLCAAALALTAMAGGRARAIDWWLVQSRWKSFATGIELLRSEDTRYQNVALGRLADQYSLYANGIVTATWPDHAERAIGAHLAACMAPSARRILVLGGGEDGLLTELIHYHPVRLDVVTLDEKLATMMRDYLDAPDRRAALQIASSTHYADARRYVRRAAIESSERYDLIILAAPEPASALEARLYTQECFKELSALLDDDGVLALKLSGSVGYWSPEAAQYVGSVVEPLQHVFPDVLLTFGYPTQCFAAKHKGVLAENGDELARRYTDQKVESPYFDPLWFQGASDLMDPEKRAAVKAAIKADPPSLLNTDERPAAALYHMRFWLQMSALSRSSAGAPAPHIHDLLGTLLTLRFSWLLAIVGGATAVVALAGLIGRGSALGNSALLWSLGTTGFATMTIELVLLYTFQVLYGYVYSMMGLVVGMFMFGLVLGSACMNRLIRRDSAWISAMQLLAALDLLLTIFAVSVVPAIGALRASASEWGVQLGTFALVVLAGVLGGLPFPLAASIAIENRRGTAAAAGSIMAADSAGACLGALAAGVVLLPIFGLANTCLLVAYAKVLSSALVRVAASRKG